MDLYGIEKMLHDAMGLDAASIGSSAILRSVQERMSICKVSEINQYQQLLTENKNELRELVEEVVVPETWFFRDMQPFRMLTRYVEEEWLPAEPGRALRVLSLPCATGEEPYSIAIALIEAGLMPSQLKIDAFDISERNIKRCKTASYSENSFRGVDPNVRDRYFSHREGRYHPDILIKAMVNFDVASLLDPGFVNTRQRYDVVFCRNLLIYFDRQTQAQAATMLAKLLNKEGLLFVGHAETGIFIKNWYVSHRYPKSFVVRKFVDDPKLKNKVSSLPLVARKKARSTTKRIKPVVKRPMKQQPVPAAPFSSETETTTKVREQVADQLLEQARQLADSNKLVEAEAACLQYLDINKQDKDAYYLLGLIQLSAGDAQKAVQYFKNAVYLDPNHYDALMYLSTLTGEQGDELSASRYRERAQRVKNKQALGQARR
jgi:chemotaxis protein methyltransferase WspC